MMENINNKKNRSGENTQSAYRTSRFYCVATQWYFSVREKEDQGPYSSKLSAEKELKMYLSDYEYFNENNSQLIVNTIKLI